MANESKPSRPLRLFIICIVLLTIGVALVSDSWLHSALGTRERLPLVGIKFLDYTHEPGNTLLARFQVSNDDNVVIERINNYRFQIPSKIRSNDPIRDGKNLAKVPISNNTPKILKPGEAMILNVPVLTNAPLWRLQLHYAIGMPPKRNALPRFVHFLRTKSRLYHPVQCDWIQDSPPFLAQ